MGKREWGFVVAGMVCAIVFGGQYAMFGSSVWTTMDAVFCVGYLYFALRKTGLV